MKNYFKISMVALAVFGITACGSNKNAGALEKTSSPTTQSAKQENNPTSPTSSQQTKPSNTSNQSAKPARNLETDSNGVEWRNRKLTPNVMGRFKTLKVESNAINDGASSYEVQGGDWYGAPLSAENDHVVIDFKNIAEKDGKIYFGVHEGKFTDPTMQGYSTQNGIKVRKKDVDYLFVNQPNTTYGILFDGGTAELFYQGLRTGAPIHDLIEFIVQDERYNYRTELKGQATYRGQVLATTVQAKEIGYGIPTKPFVDGTVTLTADFGGSKKFFGTDSSVKGEIDSKTLGKIQLNETGINKFANVFKGKAFAGDFVGEYSGLFTGPKLDDAVGRLRIENEDAKAGELEEYHAVFGGVKQ